MPNWFYYGDILFELFFAITTLLVSLYSFKLHKLSEQRQFKLFGFAFLSIAVSYILQLVLLFMGLLHMNNVVCAKMGIVNPEVFSILGNYAFMVFFITGLTILTYMTFNIKSHKVYLLMFILIITALIFSINKVFSFYLLSAILLLFIIQYYFKNYLEKKKTSALIILFSIISLLASSIFYLLVVIKGVGIYYILAHFTELMIYMAAAHLFELAAYILIIINLIIIMKNGQKKR